MTDTAKKLTGGQKFMAEFQIAAQNKEALLNLAAQTIRNSHTGRKYSERGLPESSTALDMRATFIYAKMRANISDQAGVYTRKDLSTDQRLILIKQRYQKLGFGNFDEDFAKTFPKEFGNNHHNVLANSSFITKPVTYRV